MTKKTKTQVCRAVSKSSFIKNIGYNRKVKTLIIEFANGNQYAYRKVPEDVFKTFWEAKSYGYWYNSRIKGEYESEKIN